MIKHTISTEVAQQFYDRLGAGHDAAEIYEGRAKRRGLTLLQLVPGRRMLNVGVGTGKEHALIQAKLAPGGTAFGLDLSPVMLRLAQSRTGAPLCRADACLLPLATASVDALFSSYVLDLLPLLLLPDLLADFRRILKPGGRMVLVSLTEGINLPSRTLVSVWKAAYAISPAACGGCRPLQLAPLVQEAGFNNIQREVVVQLGIPSEIIVAENTNGNRQK